MRRILLLSAFATAACLAGCQWARENKIEPYVPLPGDMATSLDTPEKPAPPEAKPTPAAKRE